MCPIHQSHRGNFPVDMNHRTGRNGREGRQIIDRRRESKGFDRDLTGNTLGIVAQCDILGRSSQNRIEVRNLSRRQVTSQQAAVVPNSVLRILGRIVVFVVENLNEKIFAQLIRRTGIQSHHKTESRTIRTGREDRLRCRRPLAVLINLGFHRNRSVAALNRLRPAALAVFGDLDQFLLELTGLTEGIESHPPSRQPPSLPTRRHSIL